MTSKRLRQIAELMFTYISNNLLLENLETKDYADIYETLKDTFDLTDNEMDELSGNFTKDEINF